jgi:threonine dehydrogenase-like Zn-dependent dehydrogenase
MTDGRGPDHCIDAVGMEAHGNTIDAVYDRVKTAVMLETDRSHALRAAIFACAKGGTVSHRVALNDAPAGYKTFHEKKEQCIKVVLRPHGKAA